MRMRKEDCKLTQRRKISLLLGVTGQCCYEVSGVMVMAQSVCAAGDCGVVERGVMLLWFADCGRQKAQATAQAKVEWSGVAGQVGRVPLPR